MNSVLERRVSTSILVGVSLVGISGLIALVPVVYLWVRLRIAAPPLMDID